MAAQPVERPAVVLRKVAVSDLDVFFEQQLDPDATRMAAFPARDRDAFFTHWNRILSDGTVTIRTILVDGAVGGNVLSFMHEGTIEVGYWLGREFWGCGVATKALAAFVSLVEDRPLSAAVAVHNAASIRVLEKCGFARFGREDGMLLYRLAE